MLGSVCILQEGLAIGHQNKQRVVDNGRGVQSEDQRKAVLCVCSVVGVRTGNIRQQYEVEGCSR